MRVLTVGNLFPPHHLGGYELIWASAVAALRRHGHEVSVLCTNHRLPPDRVAGAGEDPGVHRELRWYWREHDFPPQIGWRKRLAIERHNARVLDRHLDEFAPDAVSWWAMGGMSTSLIERVRRAGLPATAFVIDEWLLYAPRLDRWIRPFSGRPRAAGLAERLTRVPARVDYASAARYLFASSMLRDRARLGGYEGLDADVVHPGVDSGTLPLAPAGEWEGSLLYVGRVEPRKGVDVAVAALAELDRSVRLRIVGPAQDGHDDELRAKAQALGVAGRVSIEPALPHDRLAEVYAGADAVLFPVRWEEPWGLVPLEAMAAGRPVIATGSGGSGEYLADGENCLRFGVDDVSALAAAVRRLAGDDDLRQRLRDGGLATARRFTAEAFNRRVREEIEGRRG